MPSLFRKIFSFIKYLPKNDRAFSTSIKTIVGLRPYNLSLYRLAMQHSSASKVNASGFRESNERLEYFGDAVLGLIIAEMLFVRFPYKDEGFLTEMRSKIVNRESLNQLGKKIGLKDLVNFQQNRRSQSAHKSIYGDTLEALIGAVYLDLGYNSCRRFVVKRLIDQHYDLNQLMNDNSNFKSQIIEWAQKENVSIDFEAEEVLSESHSKQFVAKIIINGEAGGTGYGMSKKKAEQDAAQKTLEKINTETQ